MRTYAVIPAAGSGHRFDGSHSLPKQYTPICEKPLIYHTINSFLRYSSISSNLMKQFHLLFGFQESNQLTK